MSLKVLMLCKNCSTYFNKQQRNYFWMHIAHWIERLTVTMCVCVCMSMFSLNRNCQNKYRNYFVHLYGITFIPSLLGQRKRIKWLYLSKSFFYCVHQNFVTLWRLNFHEPYFNGVLRSILIVLKLHNWTIIHIQFTAVGTTQIKGM